ncbi:hypothetical protein [Acinetobacter sp. P1(2025)]|uniref:hypothetical protein n=1 Tax=Acinetobacter sp. P1(2025) TaxID=3446120 RepID=UPI003F535772
MKYQILSSLLFISFISTAQAETDLPKNNTVKDNTTEQNSYFKDVEKRFKDGWKDLSSTNVTTVNKQYDIVQNANVTIPSHNSSYIPQDSSSQQHKHQTTNDNAN